MRYIILSADSEPGLYEAPDEVAEQLADYADAFLEHICCPGSAFWKKENDASGQTYDCLTYTEADFVVWLNRMKETRSQPVQKPAFLPMEERVMMMETAEKEKDLPLHMQQYPWYNF